MEKKTHFYAGIKDGIPILLGYIPIASAFGILASSFGIHPLGVAIMSLILFTGSAQFIFVSMLSAGAAGFDIITTIFFVNFRHFLMSSAYSQHFKKERSGTLMFMSHFITDESFAIGINKAEHDIEHFNKFYLMGVQLTGYLSWFTFTVLGSFIGGIIPDYKQFGLDFALSAMFIGLLALMIDSKKKLFATILAGVLSSALMLCSLEYISVIVGAVISAAIITGVTYDRTNQ